MYCVKCGVKLQDGTETCPLCQTPVWNPDQIVRERSYPDSLPERHRESGRTLALGMTILAAVEIIVVMIVCFRLYGELRWGGYAIGGIGLFYIIAFLPQWFHEPKGEIFVPVDHAAAALYGDRRALVPELRAAGRDRKLPDLYGYDLPAQVCAGRKTLHFRRFPDRDGRFHGTGGVF